MAYIGTGRRRPAAPSKEQVAPSRGKQLDENWRALLNLIVRKLESLPGSQPVEIVERKGIGHPDTMCDGIAEHICVQLCRSFAHALHSAWGRGRSSDDAAAVAPPVVASSELAVSRRGLYSIANKWS